MNQLFGSQHRGDWHLSYGSLLKNPSHNRAGDFSVVMEAPGYGCLFSWPFLDHGDRFIDLF